MHVSPYYQERDQLIPCLFVPPFNIHIPTYLEALIDIDRTTPIEHYPYARQAPTGRFVALLRPAVNAYLNIVEKTQKIQSLNRHKP